MNKSHKITMILATLTSISISTEALSITMPHFYNPGKKCASPIKFKGIKIAKGCYRVHESAGSNSPGTLTINTIIEAEGSIFNSGTRRVEFIASVADFAPTYRATSTVFRVDGKTISNLYQRKYGSDKASSEYFTPYFKKIGTGKQTIKVGPVSVNVEAGINANVRPWMMATAQNANPLYNKNGWVNVYHRDSVKLSADASVSVDLAVADAGVRGELMLVNFNTGLSHPYSTQLYLSRQGKGTRYRNNTFTSSCLLGGSMEVFAKTDGLKLWGHTIIPSFGGTKELFNRKGKCLNHQHVNIHEWVS